MATIRRRNGHYQAQVRRLGFPAISRSFASLKDAERWAAECELEILSGSTPKQRCKVTFDEAISLHLQQDCDRFNGKPRAGKSSVVKRARRDLGAYRLDALTPKVLSDWRDTLLSSGLSNQTVRHHLGLISVVFNAAIKRFHVYDGNNPVKQIEKPSVARTGRTRTLTQPEVDLIVEGLSKPLRAYILIAFETGMRRGEIERIEASHMDEEKGTLLIPITKNGRPRLIPISPNAVEWVKDLLAGTDKATKRGHSAYQHFANQAKKHGIKDARFHDLRHSAVTRFFEKGLGHFEVAAISGHTTMQMLQRYTHISVNHLHAKLYGKGSQPIETPAP